MRTQVRSGFRNNFGTFPNEKEYFRNHSEYREDFTRKAHQGSMSGSNTAQNGESEPRGPAMEKQNAAVRNEIESTLQLQDPETQNGPGDLYLTLKRMLVGDGHKRAWWNVVVKE